MTGALSIPMGWLMRLLIPVEEDPNTFFFHNERNLSPPFNPGVDDKEDVSTKSPLQRYNWPRFTILILTDLSLFHWMNTGISHMHYLRRKEGVA